VILVLYGLTWDREVAFACCPKAGSAMWESTGSDRGTAAALAVGLAHRGDEVVSSSGDP
jgi:hypothetical protein